MTVGRGCPGQAPGPDECDGGWRERRSLVLRRKKQAQGRPGAGWDPIIASVTMETLNLSFSKAITGAMGPGLPGTTEKIPAMTTLLPSPAPGQDA